MLGWSIIARAWRSASKRAMTWRGVHARLDDLERDLAADRLLLLGHVDDAHAPFADLAERRYGPIREPGPSAIGRCGGGRRRRDAPAVSGPRPRFPGRRRRAGRPPARGRREALDAAAELGVAGAGALEVGGALGRVRLLQGGHEDRLFTHGRARSGDRLEATTSLPPGRGRRGAGTPRRAVGPLAHARGSVRVAAPAPCPRGYSGSGVASQTRILRSCVAPIRRPSETNRTLSTLSESTSFRISCPAVRSQSRTVRSPRWWLPGGVRPG